MAFVKGAKRGPPSPEERRPRERKSANGYCVQVRGAFDRVAVSCRGVPKTPGREESHQARFQVAGKTSSPQRGNAASRLHQQQVRTPRDGRRSMNQKSCRPLGALLS